MSKVLSFLSITMLAATATSCSYAYGDQPGFSFPPVAHGLPAIRNGRPEQVSEIWRVSNSPSLRIGTVHGAVCSQMGNFSRFAALGTEHFAIEDAGTIRVFDTQGRCVTTLGRPGQGPGEIQGLVDIAWGGGDTVLAYERTRYEFNTFSVRRGYITTTSTTREMLARLAGGYPTSGIALELNAGGVLLLRASRSAEWHTLPAPVDARDTVQFLALDDSLRVVTNFGSWPRRRTMRYTYSSGNGTGILGVTPGFVPDTYLTSSPNGRRTCIGDAVQPAVACFDRSGSGLIISWQADPVPVTQDVIRNWSNSSQTTASINEAELRGLKSRVRTTTDYPYFQSIFLDAEENLWVRPFANVASDSGTIAHFVFGRDGKLRAKAMLPARLSTARVFGDHVLTTMRDSLDVTYLVKLPLIKR